MTAFIPLQDKLLLKQTKDKVDVTEESIKKLDWEYEILQQKFTKFKEERDILFQQLETAVYEQQQKAGFKRLLLEKSLEAVHDTLEKKEVALHEVAVSANLRPDVRVHTRTLKSRFNRNNFLQHNFCCFGSLIVCALSFSLSRLFISFLSQAVGNASRSLEQALLEKNKIAADLEDQLREWRQAYYHVVRTYEAKLEEFGISPAELGFEPGPV